MPWIWFGPDTYDGLLGKGGSADQAYMDRTGYLLVEKMWVRI